MDLATLKAKVGGDSMIPVYDLLEKRWKRIFFVDAKEQLKQGIISIDGPVDPTLAKASKEHVLPTDTKEVYDFTKHSFQELRDFAGRAKIAEMEGMSKEQLCEALDASGFKL